MDGLTSTEQQQLADYLLQLDGTSQNPGRPDSDNSDPVIGSLQSNSAPVTGTNTQLLLSVSDPDGDQLTYKWTVDGPSKVSLDGTQQDPVLTFHNIGSYSCVVLVTDGKGGMASERISVEVVITPTTIVIDN